MILVYSLEIQTEVFYNICLLLLIQNLNPQFCSKLDKRNNRLLKLFQILFLVGFNPMS